MRLSYSLTILMVAVITLLPEHALAAEYQPARIGEHDTSIAKLIRFPDIPGDISLYLRCEAKVSPGGAIDEVGCYDEEKIDRAFYRAVNIAAGNATVTAAKVDGKPVRILMLFSVMFRQMGAQRAIAVVPNHGTNSKKLGLSYIAPQRYGYNSNMYAPRTELGLLWVDAHMSELGKAGNISYLKTKWTNKETRRYAKSYISESNFIPGHLNGEPFPMRFVKPIFGHRNGFMWLRNDSRCGNSSMVCEETSKASGRPRYVFDD